MGILLSAMVGLVSAAVALGVAQLVAVLTGPTSAPVNAVGQGVIRLTPESVKEFAIRAFGENDKLVLLLSTYALVAVFAAIVGFVAAVNRRLGVVGIAVFGAIGIVATQTSPDASPLAAAPSIVGTVAGIAALMLFTRHIHRRPTSPSDPDDDTSEGTADRAGSTRDRKRLAVNRRGLLTTGGAAAAVALLGGGAGTYLLGKRFDVTAARRRIVLPKPSSQAPPLPASVDLKVPELTSFTTPNSTFYRVDTALVLPQINPDQWLLRIHGMVDREITLGYADLLRRRLIERDITFTCVSNEIGGQLAGHARWLGVPLIDILREAGPHPDADQIFTTSQDGWTCGTPTDAAMRVPNAMLAIGMNGEPLPLAHGFPVRMIVPGLYGYVSGTKWITDLELTTFAAGPKPYWVRRHWAATAPIKTMSRIDTPRALSELSRGKTVKVAGMAWAQNRGVSKVEVRVGDGDWRPARMAAAANTQTWRQWVWDWTPASTGLQSLSVRATDGTGAIQTNQRADPFPNGSSGWHTVSFNVS